MIKSWLMGAALALATTQAVAADISPLVAADWLAEQLGDDDLVVLDVRSSIDNGGDRASFEAAHVPGSIYSSYTGDGWRENRDGVTGLLPPASRMERLIGELGIDNDDRVVIVPAGTGATDFGSAARVYWTFKVLGHDAVGILDGGFAGWRQQGHEVASGPSTPGDIADFKATRREDLIATTEEVETARDGQAQLVDARPEEYFRGQNQSPAASAPGTIPGARNLPHASLLAERDRAYYLDIDRLQSRIDGAELNRAVQTVAFCNTGHWAATDWFVLSEVAGFDDVALYDGSMSEWTSDDSRPVAVAKRGIGKLLEFFE